MAFKKMVKPQYPPRHWSLVGYPGSGKSTFAAQMRGPKVVIDADHRFTEVLELAQEDVLHSVMTLKTTLIPTTSQDVYMKTCLALV